MSSRSKFAVKLGGGGGGGNVPCIPYPGSALASTPGRIFAFTSDLAKIRLGIDCILENMPPSLINRDHEVSTSFSAYQAAPNMSKLPKTAVFFGYKSIKSSWLNTEAKVGRKIVFTLLACVFRLASSSTHIFGLRIETAIIFQLNS